MQVHVTRGREDRGPSKTALVSKDPNQGSAAPASCLAGLTVPCRVRPTAPKEGENDIIANNYMNCKTQVSVSFAPKLKNPHTISRGKCIKDIVP